MSNCKLVSIVAAAATAILSGVSQGAAIYDVDSAGTLKNSWTIGQPSSGDVQPQTVTAGSVYSNQTNFTGFSISVGGATATNKNTSMIMDDINTTASAGFTLGVFSWSVGNGNTVSVAVLPRLRFFATDGAGGGPGTFLGGINFNAATVPASTVSGYFFDASTLTSLITLPQHFWAGQYFNTSSGSAAQLNKIGPGTFNPPDVGTSADQDFLSSTAASGTVTFTANNPGGSVSVSPFAAAPVASFEWEFNPVPESSCLGLFAPLAILVRRRRTA